MGLVASWHVASSCTRDWPHVSPGLAGRSFATESPGKPPKCISYIIRFESWNDSLIHGMQSGCVVKVKVIQSCPALCDPMDYTVLGILQARIQEWVAIPFSRGSSQPRSPALQADSLPSELPGKPKDFVEWVAYPFSSRSSRPRNRTRISCIASGFFTNYQESPMHVC